MTVVLVLAALTLDRGVTFRKALIAAFIYLAIYAALAMTAAPEADRRRIRFWRWGYCVIFAVTLVVAACI